MNRLEKRHRILDASQKAFCENGYDKTSVAVICEYAGIVRATFYQYFKNRQEVFRELIWQYTQKILGMLYKYNFKDPHRISWEEFRYTRLVGIYQEVLDNRELWTLMLTDGMSRNPDTEGIVNGMFRGFIDKLAREIGEGKKRGILEVSDPQFAATCSLGVFLMVTQQYIIHADSPPAASILARKVMEVRDVTPLF